MSTNSLSFFDVAADECYSHPCLTSSRPREWLKALPFYKVGGQNTNWFIYQTKHWEALSHREMSSGSHFSSLLSSLLHERKRDRAYQAANYNDHAQLNSVLSWIWLIDLVKRSNYSHGEQKWQLCIICNRHRHNSHLSFACFPRASIAPDLSPGSSHLYSP